MLSASLITLGGCACLAEGAQGASPSEGPPAPSCLSLALAWLARSDPCHPASPLALGLCGQVLGHDRRAASSSKTKSKSVIGVACRREVSGVTSSKMCGKIQKIHHASQMFEDHPPLPVKSVSFTLLLYCCSQSNHQCSCSSN